MHSFFHTEPLNSGLHLTFTAQCWLATPQILNNHMCSVATILDSAGLECWGGGYSREPSKPGSRCSLQGVGCHLRGNRTLCSFPHPFPCSFWSQLEAAYFPFVTGSILFKATKNKVLRPQPVGDEPVLALNLTLSRFSVALCSVFPILWAKPQDKLSYFNSSYPFAGKT